MTGFAAPEDAYDRGFGPVSRRNFLFHSHWSNGGLPPFRHVVELSHGNAAGSSLSSDTASVDGRAVRCDGPIHIRPDAPLTAIRKTDLIFMPTTGLSID